MDRSEQLMKKTTPGREKDTHREGRKLKRKRQTETER